MWCHVDQVAVVRKVLCEAKLMFPNQPGIETVMRDVDAVNTV